VARRLLALLRGHRALVVVSVTCRVVNVGLGVTIPAIAVAYLPLVAVGSTSLGLAVLALTLLAVVKGLFRYLEQYTGHAVAFRLLTDLRNQVFHWLRRLEPSRLQGERSGDLVARISGDIDRVEPFFAHTIAPMVAAILVPILTLAALGVVAGPWPVAALVPFVLSYLGLVPWIGSKTVATAGPEERRLVGQSAAAITDIVQGAREIAVLGAGERVLEQLGRSEKERAMVDNSLARAASLRSLIGGLLSGGAVVAVTLVGAAISLQLETLAVSVVLAWTIWAPIRALEPIVPDTEQSLEAAARLFALEDMERQRFGDEGSSGDGAVRFEGVTVRSGSKTLVDNVDLTIEPGTFLGVVGPSGSGKTTLVQTLLRQRDPEAGFVTLGGMPIAELSPSALSNTLALVPQRPDLFYGTIASNLLMAAPNASESEMRAALARASLLDWVNGLALGLETPVGERGVGMSGGQLQRLTLARAFLRDPAVLVLDEATSELDAGTEAAVLEEVYAERGRRTLVVVAHRMVTLVPADVIAVMDRGRLVELGAHDSLLEGDGLYAALWRRHEDLLADV